MKSSLKSFCSVGALLILNSAVLAADRLVPSVYPSIQAGIDAAADGDTVIVAQGTYYENIDFGGKSIALRSTDPNEPNIVANTVVDANGSGTVVTFPDAAGANCLLAGFTVTHGDSSGDGGGILCWNGAVTINRCIITGNCAYQGAGIYSEHGDLMLTGCTLHQNVATEDGGAILNWFGDSVLTSCTFSENVTERGNGGGINSIRGKLALTDCAFSSNWAEGEGGGVATDYNSVTLTDCTFTGNSAGVGGGMNNSHMGATATNCIFTGNSAEKGGGICSYFLYSGELRLSNCTFSGNVADYYGGAVCNRLGGDMELTNCIAWGNSANEGPQIAMEDGGTLSISYSCLQGGDLDLYAPAADLEWGDGNINADPCFADEAGGDLHLRSIAGRWDANTNGWVVDGRTSPCIDTGHPSSDWTAELWPHGKRINMGAFGGMTQASMSQSQAGNISDIDCSNAVDGADLRLITDKWLYQEVLLLEDLDRDGLVNGGDFAAFADNWRWEQ